MAKCLPSPVQLSPADTDWLHDIKHDRLMVRGTGARVRLFSCHGHDWVARYLAIAAAAAALQARSFHRRRGGRGRCPGGPLV